MAEVDRRDIANGPDEDEFVYCNESDLSTAYHRGLTHICTGVGVSDRCITMMTVRHITFRRSRNVSDMSNQNENMKGNVTRVIDVCYRSTITT